jgi:hypothetical protein
MTADLGAHPVDTPITDGVRTVNFFNGRLLTAADLRREQDANRILRDRLGQALGDGVVAGLRVRVPSGGTAADPVVEVTEGIAVTRAGTALRLTSDTRVSLAGGAPAPLPGSAQDFAACTGLAPGTPLVVSGIYLLTVAPAGAPVGRAPVSGLGNETAACNTDACAEGVSFRLLHLAVDPALLADTARLRNRLAHLVFGTGDPRRTRLERDPFGGPAAPYGLLDALRPETLRDDEVPLACLLWTPGPGIRFVDEWSVRRRVGGRGQDSDWPELTGQRRRVEGEATFLQFQAELADLARGQAGAPVLLAAKDRFRWLPAAGLVPLRTSRFTAGFDLTQFFSGVTTRPATTGADAVFADAARVEALLLRSFQSPPVDPSSGHFVWTYLIRQNIQASPDVQPYVLFASGLLPYIAEGQDDLSHYDFGNYAL